MPKQEDSRLAPLLPSKSPSEDKRLERLYEYTKWHIQIYLSMGAGIVALVGSSEKVLFIRDAIGHPALVLAALVFMAVAGMAGGTVVSTCTQFRTFREVWHGGHAPLGIKYLEMTGEEWARLEHLSFWLSLGFLTAAVLTSTGVSNWIRSCGVPELHV